MQPPDRATGSNPAAGPALAADPIGLDELDRESGRIRDDERPIVERSFDLSRRSCRARVNLSVQNSSDAGGTENEVTTI